MKKGRLEAFSDGVFAIVITLLILEVKLPDVEYEQMGEALKKLLPNIGVYVLSFLLIGLYWVFHHHGFGYIKEADGVLIWINIIFLLFLSFLPFPTSILGRFPFHTWPVVIYCMNLLLANSCGFLMLIYLKRNPHLAGATLTPKVYAQQMRTYIVVNLLYILCIAAAFFIPQFISYVLGVMTIALILRSVVFMGIGKCRVD